MFAFLGWLETTALSVWVRESTSVLAFPAILVAHAIGMGLAAGINAVIALRVLGAAAAIPIRELRRFVPIMWAGFWLNAASGVLLLTAYPTKALTNPVFWLKLTLIGLGMTMFVLMRRRVLDADGPVDAARALSTSRWLAATALVSWAGAITAGRLLAYTYTHLMADWP